MSGLLGGDYNSMAKNGELHKIRLTQLGQRLTVDEYVAPKHYGFMLRKPRAVRCQTSSSSHLHSMSVQTMCCLCQAVRQYLEWHESALFHACRRWRL